MARNGSGAYSRVPGSAYTNGTTADGSELDAEFNDLATEITFSLAKDGQTAPTANLPMATYRHTGVGAAAARTDYARVAESQDSTYQWLTTVAGTNTITATGAISVAAYATGQTFRFATAGGNTSAVTLNINSIGAKAITKNGTTALISGDLVSGAVYEVTYDGTRFQLQSSPAAGGTFATDITMSGASIFDANASIAAHATTMDPWSLGNYVTATGAAVTFTGMAAAPQAGAEVEIFMNAAHVFTDGAVFEVDGNANYTATIGDRVLIRAKSTTVFTVQPIKADGTAVAGGISAATQAEMEAASSNSVSVTPGRTQYHPGVAKAWVRFNGTGVVAINGSHNVSSITDNGVGNYTVNFTTAFSSVNYCAVASSSFELTGTANTGIQQASCRDYAVGSVVVLTGAGGGLQDHAIITVTVYGDQ